MALSRMGKGLDQTLPRGQRLHAEIAVHDGFALVGLGFFDGALALALDDLGQGFHDEIGRAHV